MLLVITYSCSSRQTLQNVCSIHGDTVVEQRGRVALFRPTYLGAFLALRLCEKHGNDVHVERTRPFNEFADVPEEVRLAASEYEKREKPSTPYPKFAAGTNLPTIDDMRERTL